MYKVYCRIYQKILQIGEYFLPWREPFLIKRPDAFEKLSRLLTEKGYQNVLIVTDKNMLKLGLLRNMFDHLKKQNIDYIIYDSTVPNPTDENVIAAAELFKQNNCQAIIAFGGGSPLDCAKGVGAKIARPNKDIMQLQGLFKIRKRIPPLIAVPTTAGTGSEATIAAVISDAKTHRKHLIMDLALIPRYAVLDPDLTLGLPPEVTAATGMDVLTHAIESYISKSTTKKTRKLSLTASKLVFENLADAYNHGNDLRVRTNMLNASYDAGVAFTRAFVGYVHAIAHAVGGMYSVPHGFANAVILPYVLKSYGASIYQKLADLADVSGIAPNENDPERKAVSYINAIESLNAHLNIPTTIKEIKKEDIPTIAAQAAQEANPFYPVPKIFTKGELEIIIHKVAGLDHNEGGKTNDAK